GGVPNALIVCGKEVRDSGRVGRDCTVGALEGACPRRWWAAVERVQLPPERLSAGWAVLGAGGLLKFGVEGLVSPLAGCAPGGAYGGFSVPDGAVEG
ncbi:hypothetical protein MNEG_11429, partial [Monoraphidium neglectum]